jgi:hypothetical protein
MKYIFLLLLFCSSFALGQTRYHKGYIVTHKLDTIKGDIGLKEWNYNPNLIYLKSAEAKERKEYTINDILILQVPDVCYYQKYQGPISIPQSEISSVIDSNFVFKEETVLLKRLFEGTYLSLFSYKDATKERFFVKDKNDKISELLSNYYHLNGVKESYNPYKKQLRELLNTYGINNEKSSNAIRTSAYNEVSLIKLFKTINLNQQTVTTKKSNSVNLFFGLTANNSKVSFHENHILTGKKSEMFVTPGITGGFIFYTNPHVRKIAFNIPIHIYQVKAKAEGEEELTFDRAKYGVYNYEDIIFSLSPNIVYNYYNKQNFKLYVSGGISFSLRLNTVSNYITYFSKSYIQSEMNNRLQYDLTLNKAMFDLPLETGVSLKRIQLFAAYLKSVGKTIYSEGQYNIQSKTYRVGVRYLFGKIL